MEIIFASLDTAIEICSFVKDNDIKKEEIVSVTFNGKHYVIFFYR